jgi:hypothetical protein
MQDMQHIGQRLSEIEQNMKLNTAAPVARYGFTQLPNFILRNPDISVGAKTVYALLLSYAWHNNLCFPGQDRLAQDMGLTRPRVTQLLNELQDCNLIEIARRGQGKTNFYTVNFVVRPKGAKAPNTLK